MLTIVVVLLHNVNHDENAFQENMIWLAEANLNIIRTSWIMIMMLSWKGNAFDSSNEEQDS
jgi:hypothetical protein